LRIVPSLELDGAAKQLTYLSTGLPAARFDTHIIALKATQPAIDLMRTGGVVPDVLDWHGTFDAVAFWRLWKQIQRWKPDLVHIWSLQGGAYEAWAAAGAFRVKKLVVSVRSIDGWKKGNFPIIHRWLVGRTDCFVANALAVRRHCMAAGIPADKITIIPDGVAPLTKSSISRRELLSQLLLPPDAKLIAYLGSLTKQKRLKELIWSIDQLKAVGMPAHLLMIGEGPLRTVLQRYCWLNQVEDHVHFLGFRNDVPCLLSHVDVLWQAGAYEGQSNAVLEAMAAGIPVVAADAAGNRELVVAGETGYLVPLQERAGFARCTMPLLENPELAARLGAAGRTRALRFHRVDDMVTGYAKLYRQLLE
jgi:glycosyltransferase involved in cell wall biosynthesis